MNENTWPSTPRKRTTICYFTLHCYRFVNTPHIRDENEQNTKPTPNRDKNSSHKESLPCFGARPKEWFRSKMNRRLRSRSNAAPYFAMECFLSILIRSRRVYALVVLGSFLWLLCDFDKPLIRNSQPTIFTWKKNKTPLNQPKSRMYEFKTRTYMRTHTFDAYMLSIQLQSRARARKRDPYCI